MPERFYCRKTRIVARELLSKSLVHRTDEGIISGRIVETEAYLGRDDPGSHAHCGVTSRNRIMFGPPGRAYIYLVYGSSYCLNVVTEKDGVGGAVLIRALEPEEGIGLMEKNRRIDGHLTLLTNGPGKLTQALGITGSMNGADLTGNKLYILSRDSSGKKQSRPKGFKIVTTSRIGIKTSRNLLYRYYIRGNRFVSRS